MEECTQAVGTQDVYDPRRMGRNNSGLNDTDLGDVLCILHPATPAAFRAVSYAAEHSPQNVLQYNSFNSYTRSKVEEADTFIIGNEKSHPMDLALRFSAALHKPELGFVFGRNSATCDIVFDGDTSRRISNMHYRIYLNPSGVLMLEDASTNGTVVDDVLLKGKGHILGLGQVAEKDKDPASHPSRMLMSGSVIQILSTVPEELVKFIVRIPNREGYEHQYQVNFQNFMKKRREAEMKMGIQRYGPHQAKMLFSPAVHSSNGSVRPPMSSTHFGMHWSGGDKYSVVGNIGKGAFATVYQIATKTDGHVFAAKELDKRRCMKNGVLDRKVTNEMHIMQSVNHPNIVQYIEYKEVEQYLYIIMEFVPGGDLQQYLSHFGPLNEPVAKRMAGQVLDALDYLHVNKITHRDIKPDNILLSDHDPDNFTIKLSDFGLSKVVADDKETFLKTFCGTLLYCAPEVFPHYDAHVAGQSNRKRTRRSNAPQQKQFHSYSQSVDIWSFAAVLWYSLCLLPPFEGVADATGRGMFEKIMLTSLDPTILIRAGISDEAVGMLMEMLNTDPSARPTPAMCLKHSWFGGAYPARQVEAAPLGVIAEEREAEAPDFASLSLGEQASQESEISINSGDIRFFDPRQSKRFKSDVFSTRDPSAIDSSPEAIFDKLPNAKQADTTAGAEQDVQASRKLFGEISQTTANSAGLTAPPRDRTQSYGTEEEAYAQQQSDPRVRAVIPPSQADASPSLLGAESMVRELKMTSPNGSGSSGAADTNEPVTPHTPQLDKLTSSANEKDEITPKPQQPKPFSRQITLAFPPSLFWDPNDPSTHTTEYASEVSGHDFSKYPSISFPIAQHKSNILARKGEEIESTSTTPAQPAIVQPPTIQPPTRPPPRVGNLVTTLDSFVQLNLSLTRRREDWGRAPSNTHVYHDGYDTRIPKRAIIIWFHAPGIDDIPKDDDSWVDLPDLQAFVMTEKRGGVLINGVNLPKTAPNDTYYGRLYTGDEIEVYSRDGEAPLRFVCEFFHGVGRQSRSQSVARFAVERQDLTRTKTKSASSSS